MNLVIGLILLTHGIAHGVGFAAAYELMPKEKVPHITTILAGRLELGESGIRVLGLVWLVVGIAFLVMAVGATLHARWWPSYSTGVALVSLALCLATLPEAKVGVVVNLAILVLIFVALRAGWTVVR